MKNRVGALVATASFLRLVQVLRRRSSNSILEYPFSDFLADAKAGRLVEVLFGAKDFLVTVNNLDKRARGSSPSAPAQLTKYRTRPLAHFDRSKLLEQLTSSGVTFAAQRTSPLAQLQSALLVCVPFVYLACVGALVHRMQNPRSNSVGGKQAKRAKNGSVGGQTLAVVRWLGSWLGFPAGSNDDAARSAAADGDALDGDPPSSTSLSPTFEDVAGVDGAKEELQELVSFLRSPERFEAMGCQLPRGVLLSGPAGTGKTLLARALANEARVTFFFASASEFVETLVGRGAARVRDLFARARLESPAIIFLDELDALGKARGGHNSNEEREQTLLQILTEMDGFETHHQHQRSSLDQQVDDGSTLTTTTTGGTGGNGVGESTPPRPRPPRPPVVLVVAATNRPHVLDPALLRPGRFDRHVSVRLPDQQGRLAILRTHAKKIRVEAAAAAMPAAMPAAVVAVVAVAVANPSSTAETGGGADGPVSTAAAAAASKSAGGVERGRSPGLGTQGGGGGAVNLAAVAARTSGFSGADLANVVNEAALLAVRGGCAYVQHAHFEAAVDKQRAYHPRSAEPYTGLVELD